MNNIYILNNKNRTFLRFLTLYKKRVFIKAFLFLLTINVKGFGSELIDQYKIKYNEVNLVSVPEFYNNDNLLILHIDYFTIFPKYIRIRRDNYIGYQNNCLDSRIYFDEKQINIYEVYFDRKKCDGKIKMIVDKSEKPTKILKYKE